MLGTEDVGARLYVRVRNPWGYYGRRYDWSQTGRQKAPQPTAAGAAAQPAPGSKGGPAAVANEDDAAGEFRLELNDLLKRFRKVMIS